jgi:hypothetical protein
MTAPAPLTGGCPSIRTKTLSKNTRAQEWGCQVKYRCEDQLLITMPFYASAAYSIGAWLASTTAASHHLSRGRSHAP